MNSKIIYWLRWLLAIPVPVVIGSVINLVILGLLTYFINPATVEKPLNLIIFPFVIGFVSILIGSKIAPKYNYKTAAILFGILILLEIGAVLITPLSEGTNPIVKSIISIIGGIAGLFIVKKKTKATKELL